MKTELKKFFVLLGVLTELAGVNVICSGAVAVSITPNTVSNTYTGQIVLQVTGLNPGDSVVVQKYLDVNANGVVDAGDFLVQQFNLTDGQATVFSGVTNSFIPNDTDTTPGQITTILLTQNGDIAQSFVGQYEYVVFSASGSFAPVTNSFTVTNTTYAQSFAGSVVNNGTNVPYAGVLVFQGSGGHDMTPVAGAVANNAGVFTIPAPAGTYVMVAFKSNFLADTSLAANVVLGSGTVVNTNLSLIAATQTISGRMVDTNNFSIGLPGVLVPAQTQNGLLGVSFTDTNGNFTVAVNANQWKIQANSGGLGVHGYLASQNKVQVDTTGGSVSGVTVALPKATAMFYGSIRDSLGNQLAGVSLFSQDDNGQYEDDVLSTGRGKYWAGVVGGLSNDPWNVEISTSGNGAYASYIFSQPLMNQDGGTNISAGQAVQANFVAILATNHITGVVQDSSGHPVTNVQVAANANINGQNYQPQTDTDNNGNYSLNVPNGAWSVSVTCNGGSNSLDEVLGAGNYQCPDNQNITITNADGVANITVQTFTTFVSGQVVNDIGTPVTFINVFAFTNGGSGFFQAMTDGGGSFHMGIVGGNYTLQLNNDPNGGFPALNVVGPNVPVTVTNGNSINNFILVAPRVTGAIRVQVNDPGGNGVPGIGVFAVLTAGATNYTTFGRAVPTDNSGAVTLPVFNGTWQVNLDNNRVQNLGFSGSAPQNVNILGNTNAATFALQTTNSQPFLSGPVWRTNRFQMRLTGVAGQNYTVQTSTNLSNWNFLFVTNNSLTNSFLVTDPAATNQQRSYRILIGP